MVVQKGNCSGNLSEESVGENDIDYDAFLSSAGEFGKYQWMLFFATGVFYIFGAFVYFGQLFVTESSPNHWCWIPELENLTTMERRNLAIPNDTDSQYGYLQCEAYIANWTEVLEMGLKLNSSWLTSPCKNGWEFDKSEIPYPTIATEMGWVCEQSRNQASAQSIFSIGSIVGGFVIGAIADRYGRLPAATMSNLVACVAGIVSIYARDFTEFAICRFFLGMGYDNCMMMTYLLILEYSAPKYRSLVANLPFAIFFTIGLSILPWIALACGHWKTLSLAISIPLGLSILAPFLLPESSRWLLSKGRIDETVKKVLTIARMNKKVIDPKSVEKFKSTMMKIKDTESYSIMKLMQKPLLRKLFICICLHYMCCMIIFDVSARSISKLEYDFFLSFTLVSITEFPSLAILSFVLDLTGRRWLTIIVLFICAIFTFLTAFISNGLASIICAIVARFTINMACNTAMQWSAEVLPTPVRGAGTATIHTSGYIAVVISPFIAYLNNVALWLPLTITGCVAVLSILLVFQLPETANKEMPQSFDAAEILVKEDNLWDIPVLNRERSKIKNVHGQVNNSFQMN